MKDRKWICGLYCRLSVEDKNNRESNSIQSQKIILNNFVENLENAKIGKVYVDDGFSGSNFDRPAFKNMISDIEEGLINCVLVKDYSRFGRDYIDVGYYIEKYLPNKDVRFISVNDNHDSFNIESKDDFKMPIMNMFNDIQSRETSKKVRSGLKARKEQGKFIGAFASYGYLKDSIDKNKLVVDKNVSHIIEQIFKWRIEGYSTYAITTKLNEMNILTPTAYKNSIGINHNPINVKNNKISFWNETTVRKILANEAYIGNTVQNKRTTKNHRTKQIIDLDESEWIKVVDTHEPIIDIEMWNKVKSLTINRTRVSPKDGKLNIFSGMIRCSECGYSMVKKSNGKGYNSYTCKTHLSDKTKCKTHTISYNVLEKCVFKTIMFQIMLATDETLLKNELKNSDLCSSKFQIYKDTVETIQKNIKLKSKILNDLYLDLKKDLITEIQYKELKANTENELFDLENQLINLEHGKPKSETLENFDIAEIFNNICTKGELTRDTVIELVDSIYINEDNSITINFKYADEIDEILNNKIGL